MTHMTPHSFDLTTAKEFVGDARVRVIEGKARADAELGTHAYAPPDKNAHDYLGQVREDMESTVYLHAFKKRLDRIARKAGVTHGHT